MQPDFRTYTRYIYIYICIRHHYNKNIHSVRRVQSTGYNNNNIVYKPLARKIDDSGSPTRRALLLLPIGIYSRCRLHIYCFCDVVYLYIIL